MNYYNEVNATIGDKLLIIGIEELSELQKELTKILRGKENREHLLEEYADVLICLEWIKQHCSLSEEEINQWIDKKSERIAKKLEEGVFR